MGDNKQLEFAMRFVNTDTKNRLLNEFIFMNDCIGVQTMIKTGAELFCYESKEAILHSQFETLKILIDNDALEETYWYNKNILHIAIKRNKFDVMELIVNKFKQYINDFDNANNTPLSFGLTVHRDKLDVAIIKLLCDNGARLDLKNNNGETCLELSNKYYTTTQLSFMNKQTATQQLEDAKLKLADMENKFSVEQTKNADLESKLNKLSLIITAERKKVADLEATLNKIQMHVRGDES